MSFEEELRLFEHQNVDRAVASARQASENARLRAIFDQALRSACLGAVAHLRHRGIPMSTIRTTNLVFGRYQDLGGWSCSKYEILLTPDGWLKPTGPWLHSFEDPVAFQFTDTYPRESELRGTVMKASWTYDYDVSGQVRVSEAGIGEMQLGPWVIPLARGLVHIVTTQFPVQL